MVSFYTYRQFFCYRNITFRTKYAVTRMISFLIDHLEPDKAYWFGVSAIGSLGEGVKSDPIIARAA